MSAAKIAVGMGARVTVLDIKTEQLAYIDDLMGNRIVTLMSNEYNIAKSVAEADLLIATVSLPGARTPVLVSEDMVKTMRKGSVIIDVSIDQGGSVATMDRLTNHLEPYFIKHGVIHYAVPNMPGAVPRTSTFALSNVTTPYALMLMNKGAEAAMRENPALKGGLNVYKGKVVYKAVADAQGLPYEPVEF
jgi:alanine dehydrogenase